MTGILEHITNELVASYEHLLDHINLKKNEYSEISLGLKKLCDLLNQITWINNLDNTDEVLIKVLIAIGKESHEEFKKSYALEHRAFASKGWFTKEFKDWKQALDLHLETLLEVEHIIFDIRKNSEFNKVCDLLNDL